MMSIVNANVNVMNASMNVPNSVISMLTNLARDVVQSCASRHGFDAEEEMRHLGLDTGVGITFIEKKGKSVGKKEVVVEESVGGVKSFRGNFPLPYNGEHDESCCSGLKENQFLMTQCQNARKGDAKLCKTCDNQASKNENGLPKFGTIEMRKACGIFEYVAPNGKSPVAYSKVMKKLNLSMEQVVEEASKRNMILDEGHFVEVVVETKKSKAKATTDKATTDKATPEKVKGKGRPKKAEKVVELVEPTDDLFASLMASSQKAEKSTTEKSTAEKSTTDEQKLISVLTAETVPKKKAIKKKVVAKEVVEEVKVVVEVAKVVVEPVAEEVKVVEVEEDEEEEEEDEEVDDVVRIEFKGVKYLKSENTGVIYNMDEDVVGKWNDKTKSIDFEEQEEEEEEYEEDDE